MVPTRKSPAEIKEVESLMADVSVEGMLLLERLRHKGKPPSRLLTSAGIDELLELAEVERDNREAARWWLEAYIPILSGRLSPPPSPGEWNAPIDGVTRRAEDLLDGLRALRQHPHQHAAFWGSSIFGPVRRWEHPMIDHDQINSPFETGLERGGLIPLLEQIVEGAQAARKARNGRPVESRKQEAINAAAFFWHRVLLREISAAPSGPFYAFAQAFRAAVHGGDEDENVERQVRAAVRPRRNRAAESGTKLPKKI